MTEAEWLTSGDAESMLTHVKRSCKAARTKAGRRKLRLFGSACFRSYVEHLATRPTGRKTKAEVATFREVAEVAERYADGLADKGDLQQARDKVRQVQGGFIGLTLLDDSPEEAWRASRMYFVGDPTWPYEATDQRRAQMMREVFGNPFRPANLPPGWRKWNGGALVNLAQTAYEERILPAGTLDPVRLRVLADALEEAGCADSAILEHLRGPGSHVPGCWVVDLLLAKA